MKNISTSKYGQRRYLHRGHIVEQVGIEWRVWSDFVRPAYEQPRVSSLAAAANMLKPSSS